MSLQDVNEVLDIIGDVWTVLENDVVVNQSKKVHCVPSSVPLNEIDDSRAQRKSSTMNLGLWTSGGRLASHVQLAVIRTFGIRHRGRGAYITDAQVVPEHPKTKPFVDLNMSVEVTAAHPSFGSEGVAYLEFLVTLVAKRRLNFVAPELRDAWLVKLYGDGRAELQDI